MKSPKKSQTPSSKNSPMKFTSPNKGELLIEDVVIKNGIDPRSLAFEILINRVTGLIEDDLKEGNSKQKTISFPYYDCMN